MSIARTPVAFATRQLPTVGGDEGPRPEHVGGGDVKEIGTASEPSRRVRHREPAGLREHLFPVDGRGKESQRLDILPPLASHGLVLGAADHAMQRLTAFAQVMATALGGALLTGEFAPENVTAVRVTGKRLRLPRSSTMSPTPSSA